MQHNSRQHKTTQEETRQDNTPQHKKRQERQYKTKTKTRPSQATPSQAKTRQDNETSVNVDCQLSRVQTHPLPRLRPRPRPTKNNERADFIRPKWADCILYIQSKSKTSLYNYPNQISPYTLFCPLVFHEAKKWVKEREQSFACMIPVCVLVGWFKKGYPVIGGKKKGLVTGYYARGLG
jgi:hypothetical protein